MTKLNYAVATLLSLVLVACGTSSGSDGGTDAGTTPTDAGSNTDAGTGGITISGVAAIHPLSLAIDGTSGAALANVTVGVVNPLTFLTASNPATAPTLADGALNTAASNCPTSTMFPGGACAWSFSNVNISTSSIGLAAVIEGTSTTSPWIPTGTGIANAATVTADMAPGSSIMNANALAVSTMTEAALVQFVDGVKSLTIAPGAFTAQGFMIGTVLGPTGTPVAGATVSVPSPAAYDIYYPSAGATGFTNGTATDATGTFIAVPPGALTTPAGTPGGNTATFTVSGTGHAWTPTLAGSAPGTCFVLLFLATS